MDDLLNKAGLAETADGSQLSVDQLWRIADEADIWPIILNRHGVPLALGRSQRLASKGQTLALTARDGGCSFPGCTHPPQWCDRHHIVDWILGGNTDLNNLTLLCRYHHTHFLRKGWTCRMNPDGLPEWTPPKWIDPEQRPTPTPASNASTHTANSNTATDNEHPTRHDSMGVQYQLRLSMRSTSGSVPFDKLKAPIKEGTWAIRRCRRSGRGSAPSEPAAR
jgi:hypothetical protein